MVEAKHTNLTGVFARKEPRDRAASLTGLLPPRDAAPTTAPAPPRAVPEPQPAPDPQPARATRPAPRPAAAAAAPRADDHTIVNLPVYLPEDLRDWLQAMPRGTTYSDALITAFEHVGTDRLRAYFTPRPRHAPSGMPLAPETSNPGSGPQRQFRVRRAQLRWIEDVANTVGAPNRSTLCVAVLRLYHQDQNVPAATD